MELGHFKIQIRTQGLKYGQYPRTRIGRNRPLAISIQPTLHAHLTRNLMGILRCEPTSEPVPVPSDWHFTQSAAPAFPRAGAVFLTSGHPVPRGHSNHFGKADHGGVYGPPYKAKPVPHKYISARSQGDKPMIQNARGLSPNQLNRLSDICRLIAGLTEEDFTKFHADDFEACWNGFHVKIIGPLFRSRKTG